MPFKTAREVLDAQSERAVIALAGAAKLGKTSFPLSRGGDIWLLDMDLGYRAAVEYAIKQKWVQEDRLHIVSHFVPDNIGDNPPPPTDPDVRAEALRGMGAKATEAEKKLYREAVAAWLREVEENYREASGILRAFRKDFYAALEAADAVAGLVAVDPTTKLWYVVQAVKLFEAEVKRARKWKRDLVKIEEDRRDYGQPNTLMEGLLARPLYYDRVSACFTMRAQNVYTDGGEKKLETEAVGFKYTDAVVEAVVRLWEQPPRNEIVAVIDSARACRLDSGVKGSKIPDPDWDAVMAKLEAGR